MLLFVYLRSFSRNKNFNHLKYRVEGKATLIFHAWILGNRKITICEPCTTVIVFTNLSPLQIYQIKVQLVIIRYCCRKSRLLKKTNCELKFRRMKNLYYSMDHVSSWTRTMEHQFLIFIHLISWLLNEVGEFSSNKWLVTVDTCSIKRAHFLSLLQHLQKLLCAKLENFGSGERP